MIAASVAIALNVGGLWLLVRHTESALPAEAEEEHVTQLVFIQREPAPAQMRAVVTALLKPPKKATKPAPPRPAQLSEITATESQLVAGPTSSGDPVTSTGGSLNLSVPEARMSFERNPVARQEAPTVEAPIRMSLNIKDRSFGGTMKRMTNASICGDLRKALRASSANAASIIASMERYNCKV